MNAVATKNRTYDLGGSKRDSRVHDIHRDPARRLETKGPQVARGVRLHPGPELERRQSLRRSDEDILSRRQRTEAESTPTLASIRLEPGLAVDDGPTSAHFDPGIAEQLSLRPDQQALEETRRTILGTEAQVDLGTVEPKVLAHDYRAVGR